MENWMSLKVFCIGPSKVLNTYMYWSMNYQEFLKRCGQNIFSFSQAAIFKKDVVFCQFNVKCSTFFQQKCRNSLIGLALKAARNLDLRLLIASWLKTQCENTAKTSWGLFGLVLDFLLFSSGIYTLWEINSWGKQQAFQYVLFIYTQNFKHMSYWWHLHHNICCSL